MANPQGSIELLDELEALGFTDEAYHRLHHFHAKGVRDTIAIHRAYCAKVSSFQPDSNNERTQRRLEFVLGAYRAGGYPPGRSDIFIELADRAFVEIPPKTVGKRMPSRSTARASPIQPNPSFDESEGIVVENRRTPVHSDLETLWREYARRFAQARIRSELESRWGSDPNVTRARIEFSYPPTFQLGYLGPLFFRSPLRVLFLGQNPGVGQGNVEGDRELSQQLEAFATGKLSFAKFNVFMAGHLIKWPSLYRDKGVFVEAGDDAGVSLIPRSVRPSISCVALLNWFPFKTVGNERPLSGTLKTAMWRCLVKPTIEMLAPNLVVRYRDSDGYAGEIAQLQSAPEIVCVWHPSQYIVNAHCQKLSKSWSQLADLFVLTED